MFARELYHSDILGLVFMKVTCGIFLYSRRTKKILVCHATRARWNSWSIPKGLREDEEDEFDAAVRELYEETGIDLRAVKVASVHKLRGTTYRKQHKQLVSFLVVTPADFARYAYQCYTLVNGSYPEIDKWKWISLEEAKILHETQQEVIGEIKRILNE